MSDRVIISVNEGKVQGIKERTLFSDVEYYAFFGIPYAQSTANQARFKDPVKTKPWKIVYDATKQKEGCVQFSLKLQRFQGSEDCLYSNIFTPQLPAPGVPLKPVIVNIHPGAFFFGSPDPLHYGSPEYVIHQDFVYVCLGYRLHILGFLNLGVEECSGNQAFKDIIMGLQWVKDNIRHFNGDPENVTLLGSSSGAVAVHILMLSPAAKGLFHKAILMGMYIFNPVISFKKENASDAFNVAQHLGFKGKPEEKKKLLSFLKRVPAHVLAEQCKYYEKEYITNSNIAPIYTAGVFVATIDTGKQAVLPIDYRKLIPSMTRVPIMFGICDVEAVFGFSRGFWRTCTENNFRTSIRQNEVGWASNLSDDELQTINDEIEAFYLNGERIEDAPLSVKMDIQTDAGLSDVYDTLIDIAAAELSTPAYVYKFQFKGDIITMGDVVASQLENPIDGTFHAADFCYWACMIQLPLSETTTNMIETFTKLVTTFARNGDPNYQDTTEVWRPSTPDNPCYLSVNETLQMVDGRLNEERMKFWHDLKKRFQKTGS